MLKLHLGCGPHLFEGWINVDRGKRQTDREYIQANLLDGLDMISDNSVDFVFSEHVLEHFTLTQGLFLLKDWCRKLKDGGVLRISIPGLEGALQNYYTGRGREWRDTIGKSRGIATAATDAIYLNSYFRDWGHKFIYDEETLGSIMRKAGFKDVVTEGALESKHAELRQLEVRTFPTHMACQPLVMEGTKRNEKIIN